MAKIILIGGGSSSGKSFVTGHVIHRLGKENVTHISLDDYYKDQKDVPMPERIKVNYDHPKAFDWKLLRNQVEALKKDQPIDKPTYDFVKHTRSEKIEHIVPKKLVIVEGIVALVDKKLRDLGDLKVFISASAERRFLRRLIRDTKERGRSFDNIVSQYFHTVQPMYDEIIKPSSIYADLIINNDGVKNHAVDVLTCVLKDQMEGKEANDPIPVEDLGSLDLDELLHEGR